MKKLVHRFGKFYSNVILNYIGIFIFVGILSVVFGDYGWLPNKDIYAISQFVYKAVIPVLIAYAAGNQIGHGRKQFGGAIAVMATAGTIFANEETGILAAMILGPLCGMLWNYCLEPLTTKVKTGLEMLVRNIVAAVAGCILAVLAFYLVAPVVSVCVETVLLGVNYLIGHKLIWLVSFVIEPAKVFFLNNCINHGILIPLGLQQAEQTGESLLFLLEVNPGPGFGILVALYLKKKEKRENYAASMFVECIGGLHEIYFPEILKNMWLLLALICGGAAGNLCFLLLHGAATAAVSPGSILSIFLVCAPNRMLSVLIGVLASALVSAIVASGILQWQKMQAKSASLDEPVSEKYVDETKCEDEKQMLKIGFICNAGVGSSAMGAALFRKKLKELQVTDMKVAAYAMDQIPDDLDALICQKDLKEILLLERKEANIYTLDSLLNQSEYQTLINKIKQREGRI